MPSKGKTLSEKEIEVLTFWVEKGAPWPDKEKSIYYLAPLAPRRPELPVAQGDITQPIDLLVDQYFTDTHISWSGTGDDRTSIPPVNPDVVGLVPSPDRHSKERRLGKEWVITCR